MSYTFQTITALSEGVFTEQRSKFIAYAVPVSTVEEAKAVVDRYRKQYYDARHVCWAYMLGPERTEFRVNDDGEPSSTAGKPILGVINSYGLTDIILVVVRYFGGVKLGTGGLIVAYRAAAQEAVSHAVIIEKTVDETMEISFEYAFLNHVMRVIKEANPVVLTQHLDMDCMMALRIPMGEADNLKERLLKIDTLKVLGE